MNKALSSVAAIGTKTVTVRLKAGRYTTWRNDDAAPHTATASGWSSPQLRKGGTYRHRFTKAGAYAYVCALHPGMKAKVVVNRGEAR